MKNTCLALFAAAFATGAYGATTQADCNDYLETSDTAYEQSSLVLGAHWHSGDAPDTGSTNYIASGMTVYGPTDKMTYPFNGDCFVLAGSLLMHKGPITWKDLRLQNGSSYSWGSSSPINGLVRIESTAESPAKIKTFAGTSFVTWTLAAKFVGDSDSAFKLQRTTNGPFKLSMPDMHYLVSGDWSEFLGTVTVATNTAFGFQSTAAAEVGNKTMGGKVVVERGGYWYGISTYGYTGVYTTLGSLEMKDGSEYWAHFDSAGRASLVVVTNELTLGKGVQLRFKNSWDGTSGADCTLKSYTVGGEVLEPLVRLKGAAMDKEPDLTGCIIPDYPAGQKVGGLLPRFKDMVCRAATDGTSKTVYVRYHDDVSWTMNTANAQTGWGVCAFNPENTSYWKDGSMPAADSEGTMLASAAIELSPEVAGGGFSYPGLTMILNNTMFLYASHLEVSNLIAVANSTIFVHKGPSTKHLRGKFTVLSGDKPVMIRNYVGSTFYLDAEMAGDGTLALRADSNANPKSYYHITGTNENFHGKIVMGNTFVNTYSGNSYPYPDPAKDWYATVYIGDGRNLGGSYLGDDSYDALTIGSWTKLKLESSVSSVTLDEPTRGIFVTRECAQIDLSGSQTLTIKSPITYGGKLLKLGGGCLALGGAARFIDGDPATEPQEGTNRLVVAAGTLKILSTNAVDGVQIELESGAELAVDANSESDGMAEFGFVNTRWATPFVTNGDPIRVRVCGIGENEEVAVPICTVTSTVAEDLDIRLLRIQGHRGSVTQRPNPDGTVTFVANIEPTGVIMLIR